MEEKINASASCYMPTFLSNQLDLRLNSIELVYNH